MKKRKNKNKILEKMFKGEEYTGISRKLLDKKKITIYCQGSEITITNTQGVIHKVRLANKTWDYRANTMGIMASSSASSIHSKHMTLLSIQRFKIRNERIATPTLSPLNRAASRGQYLRCCTSQTMVTNYVSNYKYVNFRALFYYSTLRICTMQYKSYSTSFNLRISYIIAWCVKHDEFLGY